MVARLGTPGDGKRAAAGVEHLFAVFLVAVAALTAVTLFGRSAVDSYRRSTVLLDGEVVPLPGGDGPPAGANGEPGGEGAPAGDGTAPRPAPAAVGGRSEFASGRLPLPEPKGGGPTGGVPAGPAAPGPARIMQDVITRHSALDARERRQERVTKQDREWIDQAWQDLQGTDAFRRLSPAQQEALAAIWRGLKRFEFDPATRYAALNLARALEDGRLQDDRGGRVLRALADLMGKDGADAKQFHYTADAILILGNDARWRNFHNTGGVSVEQSVPFRLDVGGQVSKEIRGALDSSNRVWGGYIEVARRMGRSVVGGKYEVGLETTRNQAQSEGVGDTVQGGPANPTVRRQSSFVAHRMGEIARETGWGNCMECAHTAAAALHDRGVRDVEVMRRVGLPDSKGVNHGDHQFVVVGRDPHSDPSKPETWGPNAVIVDPWDGGKAYRASEWSGQLPGQGPIETKVRLPDPWGAPSAY